MNLRSISMGAGVGMLFDSFGVMRILLFFEIFWLVSFLFYFRIKYWVRKSNRESGGVFFF